MTDTADIAIIGAGIMGVSTAYHLARSALAASSSSERDSVCSGSTALASGGIRHQYGNRLGVELTTHSIVTYERFEDEFGVDPQFRQHGYLILVATEEARALARRSVDLQRGLGVDVELLDAAATHRSVPVPAGPTISSAPPTRRATGTPTQYLCTTAIAARARALGVEIRQQCEVRRLRARRGSRDRRRHGAEARSPRPRSSSRPGRGPGWWVALGGVDIPVVPHRRHKFVTAPFPADADSRGHAVHHRSPPWVLPASRRGRDPARSSAVRDEPLELQHRASIAPSSRGWSSARSIARRCWPTRG